MLHAVIMAGGSGTRFWPESRELRPKQLLDLTGGRTMIQATVDRLAGLVPNDRLLVVTNRRQAPQIAAQLPEVPAASILGEPCKRDTAACIGWAAMRICRDDPDAIMAVMPSDHVISPTETFQHAIRAAAGIVAAQPQRIVTFGIRPTYPAESFGYIERGGLLAGDGGSSQSGGFPLASDASRNVPTDSTIRVYEVVRFREKPKAPQAREFVESGKFYWNAGIFVWRARTILNLLQLHQPELYGHLAVIDAARGRPEHDATLDREFAAIQGVSIDYAILEKATCPQVGAAGTVAVIEAPFAWDDVGSWQALARLWGVDEDGNTVAGRHLGVNTRGTIIRTDGEHLVATIGVNDLLIVHTPDATLVANKHDEEAVRQLVKLLQERGWTQYL